MTDIYRKGWPSGSALFIGTGPCPPTDDNDVDMLRFSCNTEIKSYTSRKKMPELSL